MTIAGASNLATSQITVDAMFNELMAARSTMPDLSEIACNTITVTGRTVNVPVVAAMPTLREWLGAKYENVLRAYAQSITIKRYEATVGIDRLEVEADQSGVVGNMIRAFLADNIRGYEGVLTTNILANTALGYDGVAQFSASHPNTASTGNNLTTSALTPSTYNAGRTAMRLFTDENGTSYNASPTHLVVGPAQERMALEITGATRPMAVSNAGAYDGTSNIVGGVTIPNVFVGEQIVIVNQKFTGNQWMLLDLSKPAKPFTKAVFRNLQPIVKDGGDMTADSRFFQDKYFYSLEADVALVPGAWQLSYGSVTA